MSEQLCSKFDRKSTAFTWRVYAQGHVSGTRPLQEIPPIRQTAAAAGTSADNEGAVGVIIKDVPPPTMNSPPFSDTEKTHTSKVSPGSECV